MKTRDLRSILPALAMPFFAFSALGQTTGVSHPDETVAVSPAQGDHYVMPSHTGTPAPQTASPEAKPSTATYPATSYPATSYPATGPVSETSYPATATAPATVPADSGTAAEPTPALIVRRPLPPASPTPLTYNRAETASANADLLSTANTDDGIVTEVPAGPHELHAGTVLKARLNGEISTATTAAGAPFSADLLTDVGHGGEVLLPAGSIVHGRVSSVHGGKRIGGQASIRLQPESVTLPDGTSYPLQATLSGVADPEGANDMRVNDEGVVQPKTHPKATAAVLGGTAATGAVTGALIGGGVGAAVGATVGAGVATYWWLNRDHQETLPGGTTLYFNLDNSLQLNPR